MNVPEMTVSTINSFRFVGLEILAQYIADFFTFVSPQKILFLEKIVKLLTVIPQGQSVKYVLAVV